jgi:hypothetical protein
MLRFIYICDLFTDSSSYLLNCIALLYFKGNICLCSKWVSIANILRHGRKLHSLNIGFRIVYMLTGSLNIFTLLEYFFTERNSWVYITSACETHIYSYVFMDKCRVTFPTSLKSKVVALDAY